jgi:2-polyprenyl-3-methyl-5-hydroxy-6-metoxy-1,4-benzoquinol methylase
MNFKSDFFRRYLEFAPVALALERSMECEVHASNLWKSPILDIGCGDGIFASVLCNERVDTGIDVEPADIECARRRGIYKELILCPGHRIPKSDGTYQTIFCNSVLEHIPDLLPVLLEANRLLAPGGRFYVTIPTDRLEQATLPARLLRSIGFTRLADKYGELYSRFWRHYHAYDETRWRSLFAQANFEVVEERAYIPCNLSTFYDFLTVLAFPSLVAKRSLDRWIFLPRLRSITAGFIYAAISPVIELLRRGDGGCLVFYALRKQGNAS